VGAVLIHYDLPLAPARIEQRIGRIDRIAARGRMRNFVLMSGSNYEREWFGYLSSAIRIFYRSVAPLQYMLADSASRILAGLLVEGAAAIATEAARMSDSRNGCDAELLRIRQQEALDALESDASAERAFFEALTAADEEAEERGREALDAWVIDRLRFQRASYGPSIFRYIHDMDRPTLVPLVEVVSRFAACLDAAAHRPSPRARTLPMRLASFERHVAEAKHIELIRAGHPFVDSMESLVRADDRGTAYAMWRLVSSWRDAPRLFFRFDFVAEADLSQAGALLESFQAAPEALRRRAQAAFPMTYRTVWLDSDLYEVRDESLLAILEMPYSRKPRADGSSDVNIRLERWALVDAMVPVGDWGDLCHRARTTAESLIRHDPEFRERCRRHADQALGQGRQVHDSLKSRIARLSGPVRTSEQKIASLELNLSEVLSRGIQAPSLRADSAGAIFLASRPLNDQ
jgi:ATP-dependent helicase HepA